MAKKKKLSSGERRRKAARRFQGSVVKMVGLVLLGGAAFLLFNPQVIENLEQRQKVEAVRSNLFESGDEGGGQLTTAIESAKEYIEHAFETIKIPKELTGSEEEIVVQELVDNLTEQVKQLPAEQVKRVKVGFCQDVIDEATKAACLVK